LSETSTQIESKAEMFLVPLKKFSLHYVDEKPLEENKFNNSQ
jgi:hypothetical protein